MISSPTTLDVGRAVSLSDSLVVCDHQFYQAFCQGDSYHICMFITTFVNQCQLLEVATFNKS